jgi:hypothetical protein
MARKRFRAFACSGAREDFVTDEQLHRSMRVRDRGARDAREKIFLMRDAKLFFDSRLTSQFRAATLTLHRAPSSDRLTAMRLQGMRITTRKWISDASATRSYGRARSQRS